MKLIALVVFFLTLPLAAHAENFSTATLKTFSGRWLDDVVSVKARAIIFPKELKIPDVRKAKRYDQPAVDTYIRYVIACMNGSGDELSKFWVKSERKELKALFAEPGALRATHTEFRKNPGITIVGLIFYGNQTTVLTRQNFGGNDVVLGVSLVTEGGGAFLTNYPRHARDIAIIEASFLPAQ